jgi:hypothetical protein
MMPQRAAHHAAPRNPVYRSTALSKHGESTVVSGGSTLLNACVRTANPICMATDRRIGTGSGARAIDDC